MGFYIYIYMYIYIYILYNFIYLFLATLSLCCCGDVLQLQQVGATLCCEAEASQKGSFFCVCGKAWALQRWASVVATHGL